MTTGTARSLLLTVYLFTLEKQGTHFSFSLSFPNRVIHPYFLDSIDTSPDAEICTRTSMSTLWSKFVPKAARVNRGLERARERKDRGGGRGEKGEEKPYIVLIHRLNRKTAT